MIPIYTVKNNGATFQTDNPDDIPTDATAKCHFIECVQQKDEPGTLVMSDSENWVESDATVIADHNSWVFVEGME